MPATRPVLVSPVPAPAPFLRVPPFPNAAPATLSRPADRAEPAADATLDRLIDRLCEARVGGAYWGARPPLPLSPYTLVATAPQVPIDGPVVEAPLLEQSGATDPWYLVSGASAVICAPGSDLALVAALAGVPVGDGQTPPRPVDRPTLRRLIGAALLDGQGYFDPFTGQACSAADAIALCAHWRALVDRNRPLAAVFGIAGWKRPTTAALLWNGAGPVRFDPRLAAVPADAEVGAWCSRVPPALLAALRVRPGGLTEIEDGFIRSAGLGADCVPPLSIVVDRRGPHFDPRQPSELEQLLEEGSFSPALLARAEALRARIVALGLGKYDIGHAELARRSARRHVLVPGQVEDDRAVLSAIDAPLTNLELLRRARAAEPDAWLIYKPHPDVEAGHRKGAIPDAQALALADEVVRDQPMSAVIALADALHVNSSLAGFEALLRGKPVTTHGVPFYAGWGLTTDLGPVPPRRTARRSLAELVAATLLVYPRYLDPRTGLPCPAEVVVQRLADPAEQGDPGTLVSLRRLQGRVRQQLARLAGAAR